MSTVLAEYLHAAAPARGVHPLDLLRIWPKQRPLVCMVSQGNSPCARWSIFASPARTLCCGAGDADPLARFAEALASTARTTPNSGELPFIGGWIGWLSYDLGRVIEPAAQAPAGAGRAQPDRDWPLLETHYCPAAYVHDAKTDEWSIVGDPAHLPALDPASDDRTRSA